MTWGGGGGGRVAKGFGMWLLPAVEEAWLCAKVGVLPGAALLVFASKGKGAVLRRRWIGRTFFLFFALETDVLE